MFPPGGNYCSPQPVKTISAHTLPTTNLTPCFNGSDCGAGNGTMHFLKSCTAANEWSRKRLLWKLFKINIMAVIPGSSLASTVGCFWPPNEAHKANWIMKGYSTCCQNNISRLLSFYLSHHTYAHRLYIGCVHTLQLRLSKFRFSLL